MSKAKADQIKKAIDDYCVSKYDDGHRWHLGASLIGNECKRYLWYVFRWCKREQFNGRMLRLFNRGHREEARFIEWLNGIGVEVQSHTDDGKQIRISGVQGHFGGSCDGIATFPESLGIGKTLLEFKTNGTGSGFSNLIKNGVIREKPIHWAQQCVYGYKLDLDKTVYMNICKNDDDIHVEVLPIDKKLGQQMEAKAEQIIFAKEAPFRLSDNPTFQKCNWCSMKGVCHGGEGVEKNCRSCEHAMPTDNAEWFCGHFNGVIPREFVKQACGNWSSINK